MAKMLENACRRAVKHVVYCNNALMAANSYRDIVDAIDSAFNASKMALDEAEDALSKVCL